MFVILCWWSYKLKFLSAFSSRSLLPSSLFNEFLIKGVIKGFSEEFLRLFSVFFTLLSNEGNFFLLLLDVVGYDIFIIFYYKTLYFLINYVLLVGFCFALASGLFLGLKSIKLI